MDDHPNRKVRDIDGWELEMYFSPALQDELHSPDLEVREDARRLVCTRFRKLAEKKYGDRWMGAWVSWDRLKITELPASTARTHLPRQRPASVTENPNCRCDTALRCPEHDA